MQMKKLLRQQLIHHFLFNERYSNGDFAVDLSFLLTVIKGKKLIRCTTMRANSLLGKIFSVFVSKDQL